MKYKEYIMALVLGLAIFIGWNKVEAEECFYIGDNFKARMVSGNKSVTINKSFGKVSSDLRNIENWGYVGSIHDDVVTFNVIGKYDAKQCPRYMILGAISAVLNTSYVVYGTDDKGELDSALSNLHIYYYKTV